MLYKSSTLRRTTGILFTILYYSQGHCFKAPIDPKMDPSYVTIMRYIYAAIDVLQAFAP